VSRRSRRGFSILTLVTSIVVASAMGGCARSERDRAGAQQPATSEASSAIVVDPVLLAFLSKARSAHHMADASEASGDVPGAIAALEALARGPRPGGDRQFVEVNEVLSDTHARLADLQSARGQFDAAIEQVQTGLEFAADVTYFRGHLFEVRGLVEERRAKMLDERGETEKAKDARKAAIGAFDEAVRIQDHVIMNALGGGDAGPL
jgi:tetratricopeptide (TPR) repeat protein